MPLPPVVVLGGGPIAVPIARSLRRRGARVVALGHATDPVRHSRALTRFVEMAGARSQELWLGFLREGSEPGAVLLPCHDEALELLARHREELTGLGYRPMESDPDVVLAMLDKERTYELARAAGVRAPRTAVVGEDTDLASAAAAVGFPLGIKPRHAHVFQRHFGLGTKLVVAEDAVSAVREVDRIRALGVEVLLTEIITGPDDALHSYYSFVDEHGTSLCEITKHKRRQYPPRFGLATFHTLHRDEPTMEIGRRFFDAIGLRGLGVVEFKREGGDGEHVIIECNHRFTLGHELVRWAGIDLALLAYERAAGLPVTPVGDYRVGATMWHPLEDLRVLRERDDLSTRAWARSLAGRRHFPLWSLRDPMPTLAGLGRKVRGRIRR